MPYLYYAIRINIYGNQHCPEHLKATFPKFTDFWKVLVGSLVTQIIRFVVHTIMPAVYMPIAKGDDEATRNKYTRKACEHTFRAIYFAGSAYWGWSVLHESEYLYEWLGGPPGGELLNMKLESIFFVYD